MSTRNKWMDWKPGTRGPSNLPETVDNPAPIFFENAKSELTKPTEPGFVSFVSCVPGVFQKIDAEPQPRVDRDERGTSCECKAGADEVLLEPTQAQIDAAGAVLAKAGVRLVGGLHGVDYAGVWSDLDGPEVRAAIAVFHPDGVPIRYLDGDVPMRFKLRRVPGEPVPANVLAAMKREPDEPWKVRDKMLEEMNWTTDGIPWAQHQAERLNKLFAEQGKAGTPGKIRPETVRHGERGRK